MLMQHLQYKLNAEGVENRKKLNSSLNESFQQQNSFCDYVKGSGDIRIRSIETKVMLLYQQGKAMIANLVLDV